MLTNHTPPIGAFSVIVKTDGSFAAPQITTNMYLLTDDAGDRNGVARSDCFNLNSRDKERVLGSIECEVMLPCFLHSFPATVYRYLISLGIDA